MGQIDNGVRAILSHPLVYSAFQSLMGAHKARRRFSEEFVRPRPGMKVLDLGCGPASIIGYLPGVEYWGFDASNRYIEQAKRRFGARGVFRCAHLSAADLQGLPPFDVVLALGLLHHLDDSDAVQAIELAASALRPGGRLLTIDPCLDPAQSCIARFLILKDRGRNVRDRRGYEALARRVFDSPRVEVRHQAWIPYTHCIMECRR